MPAPPSLQKRLAGLRFRTLRLKLTVLYVGLFAAALGLIGVVVYTAAVAEVQRTGRTQLLTAGTVFERLLATRNRALSDDAELLARDYGFRSAFATHDEATVRSALDNLAARIGVSQAFAVGLDGQMVGRAPELDARLPQDVVRDIRDNDARAGLYAKDGVLYEAVAAPIRLPSVSGWVVFAAEVGPGEMRRLEQLSALPIHAAITSAGRANPSTGAESARHGATLTLVRPLQGIGDARPSLELRYPLEAALRPFNALFAQILLIGVLGMLLLALGSWLLARSVTRPISALEAASRALKAGETARAAVDSDDEIGRLGESFNAMAREILDREDHLRRALSAAESADRLKGEFLANLNHEFRTPLNGVLGGIGAAGRAEDPLDRRRALDLVESSGRALERVLNDVLDMMEISAGRPSIEPSVFGLEQTLHDLERQFAPLCAGKGLAFAVGRDGLSGHVHGDRRRLLQVLGNLLDNAVKFTAQGSVSLDVARTADVVRFAVRDTGVGFDPEIAESLFEPFRQEDGAMSRQFGGVGLGLSLSRALGRAMGGEVTAEGAPGRGACFTLTIPLPIAAAPAQPGEGVGEDSAAIRVLLAEDHPANRMVVELILSQIGIEPVSVENGAEAVEAFSAHRIDVVLMDLQMPVMDGFDAIAAIRAREAEAGLPPTPIIVLSANIQPEHRARAAAVGANLHLAKPIVAERLYAALGEVLDAAEMSPAASDTANAVQA